MKILILAHYHLKFCRNNCGVVGYYDLEQKTFIERSSGERHNCPNYGQVEQQQSQSQSQPKLNPNSNNNLRNNNHQEPY